MSHYYFDSSALVKRYIQEAGTDWGRSVTGAGHSMITARITQVEIMSAVSRLKPEQMVTARSANAIHLLLDRHMHRNYTVLELTDIIVQQAIAVLSSYTLRAYDAVQLASALESNRRLVAYGLPPLIFVSADQRLLAAAINEGLISENPTS